MPKEKIGQKMYRFVDGVLDQKRLLKVQNCDTYILIDEAGNRVKVNNDTYRSYTKLKEDAILVVSSVLLQDNIPDVIVSLFRSKDLKNKMPYVICRQNLYDVFTNAIENDDGMMYIGCSVSQDTKPENINFNMLMGCNSVTHSDMVCVYFEDTLDDIIELIPTTQYDDVLYLLSQGFIKAKVRGVTTSLRQLLEDNHFMDDVRRGFNIIKADFVYEGNEQYTAEFVRYIEDIIKREMIAPVWVKYDRQVDISKIKDKYVLLMDGSNTLYIVSYAPGSYSNRPYLAIGDTTEVDALKKVAK